MPADPVLSQELKSLQEEVARSQRERSRPQPEPPPTGNAAAAHESAAEPVPDRFPDATRMRQQMQDLTDELGKLLKEAEQGVSGHPVESVAGALLLGMLIGYLLARR